jgi:two-component system, NtrC family, sensor kinase
VREPSASAPTARATVLDEAVLQLPWLAPGAASLIALCRLPASALWSQVSHDPGLVLFLARQSGAAPASAFTLAAAAEQPNLLDEILQHLRQPPVGLVNWHTDTARTVLTVSRTCAHLARDLSSQSGLGQPETAWICGLLAPLGWLLSCAVDPPAVEQMLGARKSMSALSSLARRLARVWNLPDWLTAVTGFLCLPERVACSLGADPVLFHLTRIAVDLARDQGQDLGLLPAARARESAQALSLPPALLTGAWIREACQEAATSSWSWQNPYQQPLLSDMVALAAENRRLRATPRMHRLELEIDHLRLALEEQVQGEADRLHSAKLEALAEFAAGAGHEINNPLAVISGQAQYLLSHEANWFVGEAQAQVRKALQAVIAQTRRMHGLLRDLMLFARPSAPSLAWVDLPTLMGEVATSLHELAIQRQVRIELGASLDRLSVHVDPEQIRQVLSCLLRNAVEAAPAEGWARLLLLPPVAGKDIEVVVEDSGSGPDASQQQHLFDPFYSGRSAGRGRGLGLPIAWRLARLHGGAVTLQPPVNKQPTRFLLRLPYTPPEALETRLAS